MGLSSGCAKECDDAFAAKHALTLNTNHNEYSVTLRKLDMAVVRLYKVPFDCTAATLTTDAIYDNQTVLKWIPIIQEYLSLNARINCFATRLIVGQKQTQQFINKLVKLNVQVINVTNGNRNNNPNEYMVSYNICVPNPHIKGYITGLSNDVAREHDYMNQDIHKQHRKMFGLYLKHGKSL